MKKKIKKVKNSFIYKFIKLGLIPLILVMFWLVASLLFNNRVSFSVLLYPQSKSDIKIVSDPLNKENKIVGTFKAKENNLGLITLRFNVYVKKSEDILTFRFKKLGDAGWSHSNSYRAGLLNNKVLFPLGFPVIKDSKDKVFQFEIFSKSNNVGIDNFGFFTGYVFSENEIFSSKKTAVAFLIKKTITSFTNLDFLLSSFIYSVPLFVYLLIFVVPIWQKRVKNSRNIFTAFLITITILDIFIFKDVYLGLLIVLVLGWFYLILKMKLKSRVPFLNAFILILFWMFLVMFKNMDFQNKINIWTYAFLVFGATGAVLEEKSSKSK